MTTQLFDDRKRKAACFRIADAETGTVLADVYCDELAPVFNAAFDLLDIVRILNRWQKGSDSINFGALVGKEDGDTLGVLVTRAIAKARPILNPKIANDAIRGVGNSGWSKAMTTQYFTFGQSHVHSMNGFTYDKDVLVKITANDPRQRMFDLFGDKWAMQYDEPPSPEYWPRGMKELK